MVLSDEYGNWRTENAVEISKKCLGIGYGGFFTIYICNNMQPQLCKQLQFKLKYNKVQLAVVLLFCKN